MAAMRKMIVQCGMYCGKYRNHLLRNFIMLIALLSALRRGFKNVIQTPEERFLNNASDIVDLEHRMRLLERKRLEHTRISMMGR
jgi:hypothetical protein